jgi:hypothetical protein
MSKNNKSIKSETETAGRGRPSFKVIWPKGNFTEKQACALNGCFEDPKRMHTMTVRIHLQKALKGKDSFIVNTGKLGKVENETGQGRRPFIYCRRAKIEQAKNFKKKPAPSVDMAPSVDPTPSVDVIPATAEPVLA